MVFYQSFFGITPEAFEAVNINLASGKFLMMIDFQVPVSAIHQSIIASEFIGINDGASSDCLNGEVEQSLCTDIRNNFNPNDAVPFKDTENRHFPGSASASVTFSSTPEVCLIQFDLSCKQMIAVGVVSCNSHPYYVDCFKDSRIAEVNLLADLPGRELQFKELNNPKPISAANPDFINPSSGEIMKGVFTPFTSQPFACNSVDFVATTSPAETTVVFPT